MFAMKLGLTVTAAVIGTLSLGASPAAAEEGALPCHFSTSVGSAGAGCEYLGYAAGGSAGAGTSNLPNSVFVSARVDYCDAFGCLEGGAGGLLAPATGYVYVYACVAGVCAPL